MLIGIGIEGNSDSYSDSHSDSYIDHDGLFSGSLPDGVEIDTYDDAGSLQDALLSGRIDAAVRGKLRAATFLEELEIRDLSARRVAVFTYGGQVKCLLPVGIDEGGTVRERSEMALMSVPLLEKLRESMNERIPGIYKPMKLQAAVLAGGRRNDAGRSPEVDRYLEEGMETVALCRDNGLDSRFLGIEVEKALPDSDIIVAPDGITGNMIFRLLFHFAGIEFLGAVYLGLPVVVVDSSSSRRYFDGPVRLAAILAGNRLLNS